MTQNQKLREALQAIANIDDATNHSVDASAALDRIGQIARQALALPTADHLPDVKKMVVDHFPDATKMIDSHTISAVVAECDMAILAKQPATGVPDDVVRDAERYRFIRDGSGWPAVFAAHNAPEPLRGDDLDSAIDAAMRKEKP